MKHYDVVTIGNGTRDIFIQTSTLRIQRRRGQASFLVPVDAKIDIEGVVLSTGGGATNAAVTFSRLGHRTAFLGTVGTDHAGEAVVNDLREQEVDVRFVHRDRRRHTSLSVILTQQGIGRTVFAHRAASNVLTRRALPFSSFTSRWFYISSLGGNFRLLTAILRHAQRNKVLVAFNPGVGELAKGRRLLKLMRRLTVTLLNRSEANKLFGTSSVTLKELAKSIPASLPNLVVVTDGSRGALVRTPARLFWCGTHQKVSIVEWTGAGDAFGSGFVSGLLDSVGNPVVGLQYGTANAESVLGEVGAKNGLLTKPPRSRDRVRVFSSAIR